MAGAIAKRVAAALKAMAKGDAEQGLNDICGSIEATAEAEYSAGGKKNYKKFIHENLGLITWMSGLPTILNIRLAYQHPRIDLDANGTCGFEDVVYHAVRCGLYHASEWDDNLTFEDAQIMSIASDGRLILPKALVWGLIFAVVISPVNKSEKLDHPFGLRAGGTEVAIDKLWGTRDELRAQQQANASLEQALKAVAS
jgi:hypothetical protein